MELDDRVGVISLIVSFPIHVPIALPCDWDTLQLVGVTGCIIGDSMFSMDSWLPFVDNYRRNAVTLERSGCTYGTVCMRGTCEWQIVRNHQQHNLFLMPLRILCKLLNGEKIGTVMILRC